MLGPVEKARSICSSISVMPQGVPGLELDYWGNVCD